MSSVIENEDRTQEEYGYSFSFPYYVTIEKVSPYLEEPQARKLIKVTLKSDNSFK